MVEKTNMACLQLLYSRTRVCDLLRLTGIHRPFSSLIGSALSESNLTNSAYRSLFCNRKTRSLSGLA